MNRAGTPPQRGARKWVDDIQSDRTTSSASDGLLRDSFTIIGATSCCDEGPARPEKGKHSAGPEHKGIGGTTGTLTGGQGRPLRQYRRDDPKEAAPGVPSPQKENVPPHRRERERLATAVDWKERATIATRSDAFGTETPMAKKNKKALESQKTVLYSGEKKNRKRLVRN